MSNQGLTKTVESGFSVVQILVVLSAKRNTVNIQAQVTEKNPNFSQKSPNRVYCIHMVGLHRKSQL